VKERVGVGCARSKVTPVTLAVLETRWRRWRCHRVQTTGDPATVRFSVLGVFRKEQNGIVPQRQSVVPCYTTITLPYYYMYIYVIIIVQIRTKLRRWQVETSARVIHRCNAGLYAHLCEKFYRFVRPLWLVLTRFIAEYDSSNDVFRRRRRLWQYENSSRPGVFGTPRILSRGVVVVVLHRV